ANPAPAKARFQRPMPGWASAAATVLAVARSAARDANALIAQREPSGFDPKYANPAGWLADAQADPASHGSIPFVARASDASASGRGRERFGPADPNRLPANLARKPDCRGRFPAVAATARAARPASCGQAERARRPTAGTARARPTRYSLPAFS